MRAASQAGSAPRVSVGMPVYNGENFLAAAVEAILGQTFDDLELIVCDNASTDQTPSIARRYAEADPRVRYYRNPRNVGAAANYNRVFELARAPLFKWAAHDDLVASTMLERCVTVLDEAPDDVVVCFPDSIVIDEDGTPIDRLPENPALRFEEDLDLRMPTAHERLRHLIHNMSMCHAVFGVIRSDSLRRTRLIDRFHSADVVLLTELALQGRFWKLPEPLFMRRLHPGISMWNKTPEQVAAWFDPENPPRLVMRHWRLFREQVRSILRADLSTAECTRCLGIMVTDELRRKRRSIVTEWWGALTPDARTPRPEGTTCTAPAVR